MDLPEAPIARALSRLLERETWARQRLAPFAGETLELRVPPLPPLRFAIEAGGTARAAGAEPAATLVVTLRPQALFALPRGVEHALREVEIAGNERLAAEVLVLARHLRWDVEEDLSRVLGDALAHRMAGDARRVMRAAADSGRRLAAALVEYAVEERALVARREEFASFAQANAVLRDGLERLEKRLEQLADG